MEFSPAFFQEDIVYVARRKNGRIDQRSGQIFYELMRAELNESGEVKRAKPFIIGVNSSYHEGPVSFSKDGREVFFTRSNTRQGLSRANERGQVGLKVYRAYKGQYDWQGIEELPFNDDQYSCMHPSLTADGNRLYFASNKPGGYGGLDIYVSDYINGKWTPAINLGPEINTGADEAFPFIHHSGTLFFASNGHPGLGGLDLFSIDLSQPGWGKVYNLQPPFNSPSDDLGLVLNESGNMAFFSSNRVGGSGQDDVYRADIPTGLQGIARKPTTRELLTVYDASESLRLYQADVQLFAVDADSLNEEGVYTYELEEIRNGEYRISAKRKPPLELGDGRLVTDRDGTAELLLSEGQSYLLVVYRNGFEPSELRFDYTSSGVSRPLEISLEPSDCIMLEGRIEAGAGNLGVPDARVQIRATNCDQVVREVRTDMNGNYQLCLPRACQYQIRARAPGYVEQRSQFNTIGTRMGRLRADLQLSGNGNVETTQLPSGATLILDKMDWENLQQGSSERLELLRQFLEDYPFSRIQLNIHVDTRGHVIFNQDRSEELANLTKEYLLANGIPIDRLNIEAHGENQPRNPCNEDQNCTDADHAANNRIEVFILQ
ncbi:MAG: OmpA family protein [Bacteroidota bacterium]